MSAFPHAMDFAAGRESALNPMAELAAVAASRRFAALTIQALYAARPASETDG